MGDEPVNAQMQFMNQPAQPSAPPTVNPDVAKDLFFTPTPTAPLVFNAPSVMPVVPLSPAAVKPASMPGAVPAAVAAPATPGYVPSDDFGFQYVTVGTDPVGDAFPSFLKEESTLKQEIDRLTKLEADEKTRGQNTMALLSAQKDLADMQRLRASTEAMFKTFGITADSVDFSNPAAAQEFFMQRGIEQAGLKPPPALPADPKDPSYETIKALRDTWNQGMGEYYRAASSAWSAGPEAVDRMMEAPTVAKTAFKSYRADLISDHQAKAGRLVPVSTEVDPAFFDPTKPEQIDTQIAGMQAVRTELLKFVSLDDSVIATIDNNIATAEAVKTRNDEYMLGSVVARDVRKALDPKNEQHAAALEVLNKYGNKDMTATNAALGQVTNAAVANLKRTMDAKADDKQVQAAIDEVASAVVNNLTGIGRTPIQSDNPFFNETLAGSTLNWTSLMAAGGLALGVYGQTIGADKAYERARKDKLDDRQWEWERQKELLAIQQGYALERIDANAAAESAGKGTPSGSVVSSNAKKGKASI